MLDVTYLLLTLALFALVALTAKAVEKLGPGPRTSAPRGATREDRG